jgi:tetratricopeptide (TPR) repeat protein
MDSGPALRYGDSSRAINGVEAMMPAISSTATPSEALQLAQSQFARALQLEHQGRTGEAESIYRQLLAAQPNQAPAQHNLAILLRGSGRAGEAENLLRNAVALDPLEASYCSTLAMTLRSLGRPVEAESWYMKALSLRSDDLDAMLNLGLLYEESGRSKEALAAYRQILAINPQHAPTLIRLGVLHKKYGQPAQALAQFDAALVAQPGDFSALYYRGVALSILGQPDEALASLRSALAQRSGNFEVTLAIANTLRDAHRYDEALEIYWLLIERHPSDAKLHEETNRLAWIAGRQDVYLRSFAFVRDKFGDDPKLMQIEAAFRLRRNEWTAAENLLRQAQRKLPESGEISGLLARSLAGQKRYEESYRLFEKAIEEQPQSMVHRQEYGFALLRSGEARTAQSIFEQGLQRAHYDQLLLAGLALAYRQQNDSRYQELVDFSRLVRVYDLQPPAGVSDRMAFNQAVAMELDSMHRSKREPIDQSLRGGTQSVGYLFDAPLIEVQRMRQSIDAAVRDYINQLPDSMQAMAHSLERFAYSGSWSCRLVSGGHHHNHVHPQGWISSAYYARPPARSADRNQKAGWLKFGESNLELGEQDRAEYFVEPAVGRLVLFPSYFWHGTVPFSEPGDRVTMAFDVVPLKSSAA